MNDRLSDASMTETRAGFHKAVQDRNTNCVVTYIHPSHCEAAHYFRHAKGTEAHVSVGFVPYALS